MFWDYRDVLRTTFHAMNFQNNFQILAQVVGQSPIPRYGYQAVWEVKRVKHLTRCVALHRTIHRAKLAKLETFVSFVPHFHAPAAVGLDGAWRRLHGPPSKNPFEHIIHFSCCERVTDYGSRPLFRLSLHVYCIGRKGSKTQSYHTSSAIKPSCNRNNDMVLRAP